MKSARKAPARRRAVRRPAPLSLSMRVERLEKTLLFKPKPPGAVTGQRFTKLCADGAQWMDGQDGTHVAVHDAKTGLTWMAEPVQGGKDLTHSEALQACSEIHLFGHADWRAPTIEELLSIVDYTRYDPAVDPEFFKGPYGWTWSSTIAKYPAGCAWDVFLSHGYSSRGGRSSHGRVRAVRAGQQLGLLG